MAHNCDASPAVDLMVDSGAFSAFTQGQNIALADYVAFLRANAPRIRNYVSLDAIPGTPEHPPTIRDCELAARQSYANHQEMKAHGLHPLPVFHQEESFDWLEQMLRDGENYIGIARRQEAHRAQQMEWLDRVFDVLKGTGVQTHGLGITRPKFLLRYPFHSVDSTTWSVSAGNGKIVVPLADGRGGFDYQTEPLTFQIGDLSDMDSMGPTIRAHVMSYAQQAGIDTAILTKLRFETEARRRLWLHYYLEFGKVHSAKILFATRSDNREFSKLLTEMGCRFRLLSYWELKDQQSGTLAQYVETGLTKASAVSQSKKFDYRKYYAKKNSRKSYRRDMIALVERFERGAMRDGVDPSVQP
jgi:hypothetical protein